MYYIIKNGDEYYADGYFSTMKSSAIIYDSKKDKKADILAKAQKEYPNRTIRVVEVKKEETFSEKCSDREYELFKIKNSQLEYFLNFRKHYESICSLLNDPSLNHDMNGLVGDWKKHNGKTNNFKEAFNFDYSTKVEDLCYNDPNVESIINYPLAYKARRVSTYFAKLADAFLTIERWIEKQREKPDNSNKDTN